MVCPRSICPLVFYAKCWQKHFEGNFCRRRWRYKEQVFHCPSTLVLKFQFSIIIFCFCDNVKVVWKWVWFTRGGVIQEVGKASADGNVISSSCTAMVSVTAWGRLGIGVWCIIHWWKQTDQGRRLIHQYKILGSWDHLFMLKHNPWQVWPLQQEWIEASMIFTRVVLIIAKNHGLQVVLVICEGLCLWGLKWTHQVGLERNGRWQYCSVLLTVSLSWNGILLAP